MIEDLFNIYRDTLTGGDGYSFLPQDLNELVKEEKARAELRALSVTDEEIEARVIADVIARMTDEEALKMRQRLTGDPGSIREYLP